MRLRKNELKESVDYYCNLKLHPDGAFTIGDKNYIPTWVRNPYSADYKIVEKMLREGINSAQRAFQESNKHPESVKILGSKVGRIQVIVQE
jgi:hypothetical protein